MQCFTEIYNVVRSVILCFVVIYNVVCGTEIYHVVCSVTLRVPGVKL